ncbi:MAG TPA: GDSL-type esterase/lipase family protein [Anaerolineales bacterium]|nr:GDSL-type esterase/lipase family protein [Anaerolineales bacterium]
MSSLTTSSDLKTPALSKRAERLLTVILAVVSPLLLIAMLEGAAYFWERKQANSLYAWELVASRRMVWVQHPEPGAGYTLMQPNSHYEWQGISVDINSHGLRGPETTYQKPSETIRILNLGDSVVMGWGVSEENTYGQQLEALLNEDGISKSNFEVINAGVPGWSLDNALAFFQAEGMKYESDVVVLDLTIANDINGKSALLAGNDPQPLRWLNEHTYFWPFLQNQLSWTKARAEGRDRVDTIDPPTNAAKYFPLDPQSERWTERWDTILEINRLAKENNIPIVLVMFPLEFQVIDESYSTLPQELFAAKAEEAGIPVLDLLPVFRQACLQKPGGECQLEDRYLFADVWMHPSAEGNKLTANELAEFLPGIIKH